MVSRGLKSATNRVTRSSKSRWRVSTEKCVTNARTMILQYHFGRVRATVEESYNYLTRNKEAIEAVATVDV